MKKNILPTSMILTVRQKLRVIRRILRQTLMLMEMMMNRQWIIEKLNKGIHGFTGLI